MAATHGYCKHGTSVAFSCSRCTEECMRFDNEYRAAPVVPVDKMVLLVDGPLHGMFIVLPGNRDQHKIIRTPTRVIEKTLYTDITEETLVVGRYCFGMTLPATVPGEELFTWTGWEE